MIRFFIFKQRRGATLAGIFSTALLSLLLLCGAGSVPIENFSPQGAMQRDLNAGGHSITNAATISTTNLVVDGTNFTGGAAGPPGAAGATGPAGPAGPTGANGTNGANYTLPAATSTTLGGVKQGANITITGDGTISSSAAGSANVTGIRKSAGAGSTDVAASQADITALVAGLYPLVSNNLSDLTNSLTAAQNLGVPYATIIPETANFTVTAANRGALFNVTTGTGNLTVTLPAAANGMFFVVRKTDNSTGTVTVNGSKIGVLGHTVEVLCDGTSYYNKFVGGAIDGSGNFTYTLPANANYNIVPSGTGQAEVGGLKVQRWMQTEIFRSIPTASTRMASAWCARGIRSPTAMGRAIPESKPGVICFRRCPISTIT